MTPATIPLHDDDIEALHVPFAMKLGGAASLLFAGVALALAAQTALVFRVRGTTAAAVLTMVVLGAMALVGGFRALRGGRSGTLLSLAGGAIGALALGVWAVAILVSGVVSLLSWASVPCALGAALTSAIALEPARKLAEARARMRERGLDLGL